MKQTIIGLEKDWMAFLYGLIGILLIAFPEPLTNVLPFVLGAGMVLQGAAGIIALIKYKHDAKTKPGTILTNLALGIATFFHSSEAIGAIGAIWAMKSLEEAGEEINETIECKKVSVIRLIFAAITIILAILLMFDPFEHFAFHVRVLGLEMISYVFVRKRNLKVNND